MELNINKGAGIFKRIIAFFIDHVTILFLVLVPFFLIFASEFEDQNSAIFFSIFGLVLVAAFALYLLKDIIGGVSLGKWFMGIAVRKAEDCTQKPPSGRLILRNVLTFAWPIEFLALCISKRKIGDKLARTTVVITDEVTSLKKRIVLGVFATVIIFAFFFFSMLTVLKDSGAYKTAIKYIGNDQKAQEVTGGITGFGFMPQGSVQIMNGEGQGEFAIAVKGKKKDITVYISLTKTQGQNWVIESFDYTQ